MKPHCLAAALSLASALSAFAQSHCTRDEDIIFSCPLQRTNKVVSLCASKGLLDAPGNGYLAYRFGAIGAVELEFPSQRRSSTKKFSYYHYFRPETDRFSMSFRSGGANYVISDEIEEGSQSSTLSVSVPSSGRRADFVCRGTPIANWALVDGAVPCDDEDMNACSYVHGR